MLRKVKAPSLPQIPKGLQKDLGYFLQSIKSILDLREGNTNKGKGSRFVRVEELPDFVKKYTKNLLDKINALALLLNKETKKELVKYERWVSSIEMLPAVTDGCTEAIAEYTTYDITRQYMSFPSSGTTYANFQIVVPIDYDDRGIEISLYYTPDTGASVGDTLTWGAKAVVHNDGDAIDAEWGESETEIVTITGDEEQHRVTFKNPIQIGGAKPGTLIDISIYRSI